MDNDGLLKLVDDALDRPDDQRGEHVWLSPNDLMAMGCPMETLEAYILEGRLTPPAEAEDLMMLGWRSARH